MEFHQEMMAVFPEQMAFCQTETSLREAIATLRALVPAPGGIWPRQPVTTALVEVALPVLEKAHAALMESYVFPDSATDERSPNPTINPIEAALKVELTGER